MPKSFGDLKSITMAMNMDISPNDELEKTEALDQQPWWLKLSENFNKELHLTDIHLKHKLKVQGSAAADGIVRIGLASAVLGAMTPHLLSSARVKRDIENLKFYGGFVDRGDRAAVFPKPRQGIKITRERLPHASYFPEGAQVELLSAPVTYEALNPNLRAAFAKSHQNIPATAQHWRHPDGPRPTLIFTHGFFADSARFNNVMFSLGWFFKKGYDILLHTLPFHGLRSRKFDLYSGIGFFSHGFAHMNECFLQGVYDLRVWMDYLEAQGVTAMGASGYSLGGYTTALVAECDDRLKFAIPNAPAVMLIDMILGWSPINIAIRNMMKKNGLSLSQMRHMTAVHCPLTWTPVISSDRLMVIGGAGDRFTSPQFVNALHTHWSSSDMHWFPGNHLMHMHQPDYLRVMKKFMDNACGI